MKTKLFVITFVLSLACISPAPIKDVRSGKISPEKTQEQVQKDQQNHQVVQGESAPAPRDTEEIYLRNESDHDKGAANAVAGASDDIEGKMAEQALGVAASDIKNGPPKSYTWIWGFVMVAIGFGIVFALKHYANKTMPDMPDSFAKKKNNSNW